MNTQDIHDQNNCTKEVCNKVTNTPDTIPYNILKGLFDILKNQYVLIVLNIILITFATWGIGKGRDSTIVAHDKLYKFDFSKHPNLSFLKIFIIIMILTTLVSVILKITSAVKNDNNLDDISYKVIAYPSMTIYMIVATIGIMAAFSGGVYGYY
jgi:hypothetical protein